MLSFSFSDLKIKNTNFLQPSGYSCFRTVSERLRSDMQMNQVSQCNCFFRLHRNLCQKFNNRLTQHMVWGLGKSLLTLAPYNIISKGIPFRSPSVHPSSFLLSISHPLPLPPSPTPLPPSLPPPSVCLVVVLEEATCRFGGVEVFHVPVNDTNSRAGELRKYFQSVAEKMYVRMPECVCVSVCVHL